jgi:hypothetical protein
MAHDFVRCFSVVAAGLALACGGAARAQWTSDPSVNTMVAGGGGDQGTPISALGTDGSVWIALTDSGPGGGYKHAVQRLDTNGNTMFAGNGVLVSPTRTNTATFVFDMEVNASNQAVVAYDNAAIYVQKVLPDGTLAWGPNGALVPNSTNGLGPRVAAFADGSAAVCWATGVTLNFQRINSDGSMGAAWQLTETGRAQSPSDMLALADGSFILMWVRAEGTNIVTSRKGLKIQKWDASNAQAWGGGTPVDVYASSATPSRGIQNGYFPALASDGAGGAIAAWYDTGATRNAWIQHYFSNGTPRFAVNGVAASTTSSATEFRLSASVAYHPPSDEYTVAYQRSNPTQSQFGLAAQRIRGDGSLRWSPGGQEIAPFSPNPSAFVNVQHLNGNHALITWLLYSGANGPMYVATTRITQFAGQPWFPPVVAAAANNSNKGRLSTVIASQTHAVAVWADGPSGGADVKAQRINLDGSLGEQTNTICDVIDFNNDDSSFDPQDIDAFLSVFSEGPCVPATRTCNDIDFNNDGGVFDPCDIDSFVVLFSEGPCIPCGN